MQPLSVPVEGLIYTLDRPPQRHGKRSVVTVQFQDEASLPPLVDRADLYAFRSRRQLATHVAERFGRQTDDVLGHLALVLDTLERTTKKPASLQPQELTPERQVEAQKLLEQPDLLDQAAETLTRLGYVGEEENKRLGYLVGTSRLLERLLSLVLMAPSGCGKSELLEVVYTLLPPESVEYLSRLTPQALFYAGQDALRHKVVVVDEQAGAQEADYSLRTLQSKGFLSLRLPGKEEGQTFTVRGPIALMSGTTSASLNPENLSRCLELSLDDSAEQTARVQRVQRLAWARRTTPRPDVGLWQDAQRLLRPLPVVIPYAPQLEFPARTSADRRGNQKLLGLIAAHTLLHQAQRDRQGQAVLATVADYARVYELLCPKVERDLSGLSPRSARVYRSLANDALPRTRREVAQSMGWVYNTAKKALTELLLQELVRVEDPGPPARYRILDRSVLGSSGSLLEPQALAVA